MSKQIPKWLRAIPEGARPGYLATLHESVREMRQLEHGWDAKGGYHLGKLERLSKRQVDRLKKRTGDMRVLKSRTYTLYRPRVAKTRRTLEKHIGRKITKKTRAVIVHTTLPKSRVRVKHGRVQTVTKVRLKDGTDTLRVTRNYYFMFKKEPRDWEEFLEHVAATVKTLPRGVYSILSSRYDIVGVPMQREHILLNMQRWFDRYEGDAQKAAMPETLIGLRWIGYNYNQAESFIRRYDDQTEKHNAWRQKLVARERGLVKRRLSKRVKARMK